MPDTEFTGTEQPRSAGTGTRKAWKGIRSFLLKLLSVVLLVTALYVYWNFFNVYSRGERKGTLIKISHKGNVFKTNEGEMWLSCRQVLNSSNEKFFFSVTSDSLYQVLVKLQDECVQLTYKQYRRTLPWRGDSPYIVTGVIALPPAGNLQLGQ